MYKNGQAGINKATVSIVFDNSDRSQSPLGYEDSHEISVTRQVGNYWGLRRNKNRLLYKLKNLHLYSLDMDTRKRFGVKISFCKCVSWTIFTFLAFLLSSNCKILYFQYNSLTLWKFIEITIKMISGATLRFRRYVTLYINYLLLNFKR